MSGPILALDLATRYGAALGVPGLKPVAISGRFGGTGASHAHVGAEAILWFHKYLKVVKPAAVFIERPHLGSLKRGTTSFDVLYRLLGLAFTIQAVAKINGVANSRLVKVEDVRRHFLGAPNLKGENAKRLVQRRCLELGWDHRSDDEADAMALWSYACEIVQPGSGHSYLGPSLVLEGGTGAAPKARPLPRVVMSAKEAAETLFRKKP